MTTNGFPLGSYGGNGGPTAGQTIGQVIGGSLTQGIEIRLNASSETLIEDVKVGTFVTIQGKRYRFFGVITDLELSSSDSRIRHSPPDNGRPNSPRK